jgi:hypothetical protein
MLTSVATSSGNEQRITLYLSQNSVLPAAIYPSLLRPPLSAVPSQLNGLSRRSLTNRQQSDQPTAVNDIHFSANEAIFPRLTLI